MYTKNHILKLNLLKTEAYEWQLFLLIGGSKKWRRLINAI